MKNVLIASTALVAFGFAGAASADGHASPLTLSGSAHFGVGTVSQGGNTDTYFIHDFDISWAATGTTDGGLMFGASGDADDEATPTVFISGAFGRLEFGDADDALDAALPGVATAGLEDNPGGTRVFTDTAGAQDPRTNGSGAYGVASGASIGDYDVTDNGLGNDVALYTSPSFGGAQFFLSYGIQGQSRNGSDAGGVGMRYTMGNYVFALGYEEAGTSEAVGAAVTATFGNVGVALQYRNIDTGAANDNEDLDASVTFGVGAGTVGVMASFDLDAPAGASDENGYGIWYDMPLGGGATFNVAAGHDAKADADEFGVGISMNF